MPEGVESEPALEGEALLTSFEGSEALVPPAVVSVGDPVPLVLEGVSVDVAGGELSTGGAVSCAAGGGSAGGVCVVEPAFGSLALVVP